MVIPTPPFKVDPCQTASKNVSDAQCGNFDSFCHIDFMWISIKKIKKCNLDNLKFWWISDKIKVTDNFKNFTLWWDGFEQ